MNLSPVLILLFLPLFFLPFLSGKNPELRKVTMNLSAERFTIEVADTLVSRIKGLQNRRSIGKNEGMLFVFSNESRAGFWMKHVKFSLDIIFLNRERKIVDIFENAQPCKSLICPTYTPKENMLYALELPAGSVERLSLKIGMVAFNKSERSE